ncbi:MAG: peptidoglycan-binding protein [Pseudorhodobacter sp.]|nr:peptidoglycan-binding protein [Pseudorhodobacter sp.]
MLPSILKNVKTHLIAGATALAVLMSGTTEAQAWGKGEQQFIAGAATAVLLGALIMNSPKYGHAQPVYQRPPVYRPPVYQPPVYQPPVYQPKPRYYRYHRPVRYDPVPVSIYNTPISNAFSSYSSNERRRIQSTLTAYGYYHGSIDGNFGPGTYGAIDDYARHTGKSSMLASNAGSFGLLDGLLF